MSSTEIGKKLVEYCRQGQNVEAINNLYSQDIVSVEAAGGNGMPREMAGLQAVLGKSQWWVENNEVHSANVEGPFPHGDDKFAVLFDYDVTFKPTGQRTQMREVGVYTCAADKVVREEFYYPTGPKE